MKYWLLIGCCLLTGCAQWKKLTGTNDTSVPAPQEAPQKSVNPPTDVPAIAYHIFVADGQSNMVGTHQGQAFPETSHYIGPLYGPSYGFARAYLQRHPDRYVKVVQCARNGTSILEHQEDGWMQTWCINMVIEAKRSEDSIDGILWWQGEADASTGMSGTAWEGLFRSYIESMRQRLGNQELPIYFVQLGVLLTNWNGVTYTAPTWNELKDTQMTFSMPNTVVVRSEDQTLADYVHYDSTSNLEIGRRLFNVSIGG